MASKYCGHTLTQAPSRLESRVTVTSTLWFVTVPPAAVPPPVRATAVTAGVELGGVAAGSEGGLSGPVARSNKGATTAAGPAATTVDSAARASSAVGSNTDCPAALVARATRVLVLARA